MLWLLQPCPSTEGRCYGGENGLLRILLCCYSVCWLQESWSCPASSLAPKCPLREGTLLLFHKSFLLSSFVSFGAQLPSNGVHRAQHFLCLLSSAGVSYPVQSSATSERVSLHPVSIEITAKVFNFLNGPCPLKDSNKAEDELCGEVPTPAFRYRISIMISPGFPHSDDNFCLPALTGSLNLCKTYPLYQMWSPFWELFLLCCCIRQLHKHWLPFPSPTKSSSNLNWAFLLETRQAVRLKASFPSPCQGLVHRVGHLRVGAQAPAPSHRCLAAGLVLRH